MTPDRITKLANLAATALAKAAKPSAEFLAENEALGEDRDPVDFAYCEAVPLDVIALAESAAPGIPAAEQAVVDALLSGAKRAGTANRLYLRARDLALLCRHAQAS